jgi:hypothetical protein
MRAFNMFNFSANNLIFISKSQYEKCNILIMKDRNTNRLYKIYDFTKTACFEPLKPYCISGKVNSADKIYLVLEKVKEDKKNYQNS